MISYHCDHCRSNADIFAVTSHSGCSVSFHSWELVIFGAEPRFQLPPQNDSTLCTYADLLCRVVCLRSFMQSCLPEILIEPYSVFYTQKDSCASLGENMKKIHVWRTKPYTMDQTYVHVYTDRKTDFMLILYD